MTPEQRQCVETRKAVRAADQQERERAEMAKLWAESHQWVEEAQVAAANAAHREQHRLWRNLAQKEALSSLRELIGESPEAGD